MSRRLFVAVAMFCALALRGEGSAAGIPHNQQLVLIAEEQSVAEAIDLYRTWRRASLAFDPKGEVLRLAGYDLIRRGRYDDAEVIFRFAVESFPGAVWARIGLGDVLVRLDRAEEAQRAYARGLALLDTDVHLGDRDRQRMRRYIRDRVRAIRDAPLYDELTGTYEIGPGRYLSIASGEVDPWRRTTFLRMTDLQSGRIRVLYPRSPTSYVAGASFMDRESIRMRVRFRRTDRGLEIHVRTGDETLKGKRLALPPAEEIRFNSGSVTLSGRLSRPASASPVPAVVLLHGSGQASRSTPGFGELENFFLLNGVATLRYDKRGVGESTGDWRVAGLRDLARDARAAMAQLSRTEGIDARRIGVLGFSQGAWVALLAAKGNPDVSFVILLSGGGVTPVEQETFRVGAELRALNRDAEAEEAVHFIQAKFDFARTGHGWTDLESLMKRMDGKAWYPRFTGRWTSPETAREVFRLMLDFDPQPVIESLDCPLLALIGEYDTLTPPEATRSAIQAAIESGANERAEIIFLPKANHYMFEATRGSLRNDELTRIDRYVPQFFESLERWVERHVSGER